MTANTILVLRSKAHGIGSEAYASAIRERVDGYDVVAATTPSAERAALPDAEIVTGISIDEDYLERAAKVRLFACGAAGVDHLRLDTLSERGVAVTNASGVHGPNMAEHALALLLSFVRRLPEGRRRQDRRSWRHFQALGELDGSTVTVVGLGAVGRTLVERLSGFDVHTVGVRYTPSKGGRPTRSWVSRRTPSSSTSDVARSSRQTHWWKRCGTTAFTAPAST